MTSSTGIGVSVGRESTIRSILSNYIRSIGYVVDGCKREKNLLEWIVVAKIK